MNRLPAIVIACGLVLATLFAFEPVRHNDFVQLDDRLYVVGNDEVRGGMTQEGVAWAWTTVRGANWHPLTWLSHMLDVELFGLDPVGHHATSLVLHLVNALLLFFVLRGMTGALWPAAFVAAAFALHPLRVESVAWVAERKDVLAGFFWLLTMAAYAAYVRRPGSLRYVGVAVSLSLGLLAKPMAVTLPFVLLLLDYWPLGRIGTRSAWALIREKIPLFLIVAAFSIGVLAIQPDVTLADWEILPLGSRLANASTAYLLYILDLFFPAGLAVLYPFPQKAPPPWQPGLALVSLLLVTAAVATVGRSRRYLGVGWLWFLGTLVPVIGLVQVGFQTRADRYTYLPTIGLLIVIAWGVADLAIRFRVRKLLVGVGAGSILIALILGTRAQTLHWRDSVALYERALAVTSGNYPVHTNLAVVLASQKRDTAARDHYRKALEIKPDYLHAHYNFGVWLHRQGDEQAAIEHFRAALRASPDDVRSRYNLAAVLADGGAAESAIGHYTRVLEVDPDHIGAHQNLGNLLRSRGDIDAAVLHYRRVADLEPENPRVHYNWGHALQLRGDLDAARDHYQQAGRPGPGYADARYRRGLGLARSGNFDAAVADLNEAAVLGRERPEPLRALAWLHATHPNPELYDPERALALAGRAAALSAAGDWVALDTLAAAQAATGQFDLAVGTERAALDAAVAGREPAQLDALRTRLELYRARKPYRPPAFDGGTSFGPRTRRAYDNQ